MHQKSLTTLEYPKIIERLAAEAAFSASKELALALLPSDDADDVRRRQAFTTEARRLMERRPNPADRRVHALHLTDTGRALLDDALALASAYEQRLSTGLTAAERERLLDQLGGVAQNLGVPTDTHAALQLEHEPESRSGAGGRTA